MNPEELKPLWESYKEQAGQQMGWSRDEIRDLIKSRPTPLTLYQRMQRPMLHFCVSVILITITSGC